VLRAVAARPGRTGTGPGKEALGRVRQVPRVVPGERSRVIGLEDRRGSHDPGTSTFAQPRTWPCWPSRPGFIEQLAPALQRLPGALAPMEAQATPDMGDGPQVVERADRRSDGECHGPLCGNPGEIPLGDPARLSPWSGV
jgi:hypothetical protein